MLVLLMMQATTRPSRRPARPMALNAAEALNEVRHILSHPIFRILKSLLAEAANAGERRRKKRNRWGDASENKAAGLMGLPTMIKANMTNEQLEAYTLHLRIQEISEKLRINDVVPADGDR